MSGTVSFVDGTATSVACTQAMHTRVVLYDLTTNRLVRERTYSTADGTYAIDAGDLPVGTVYRSTWWVQSTPRSAIATTPSPRTPSPNPNPNPNPNLTLAGSWSAR